MYWDSEDLAHLLVLAGSVGCSAKSLGRMRTAEGWEADKWQCRLRLPNGSVSMVFWKGTGHNGKEPDAQELAHSCMAEAQTAEMGYRDYLSDFGMEDCAKSRSAFGKMERQANKFMGCLGPELAEAVRSGSPEMIAQWFTERFGQSSGGARKKMGRSAAAMATMLALGCEEDEAACKSLGIGMFKLACAELGAETALSLAEEALDSPMLKWKRANENSASFMAELRSLSEAQQLDRAAHQAKARQARSGI